MVVFVLFVGTLQRMKQLELTRVFILLEMSVEAIRGAFLFERELHLCIYSRAPKSRA